MNAEINNNKIIGLKKEVKRQSGFKRWEKDVGNHTLIHLVNSWRLIYCTGLTDELTEMIWDYVLTTPSPIWRSENTKIWDIKTYLGAYKNKQGKVSQAHFTENGTYYGSTIKMGETPIFYTGNFRVTRERFALNLFKLPEIKPLNGDYNLGQLFYAIPIQQDEDDIPISRLIERKRAETQVPVAVQVQEEIQVPVQAKKVRKVRRNLPVVLEIIGDDDM